MVQSTWAGGVANIRVGGCMKRVTALISFFSVWCALLFLESLQIDYADVHFPVICVIFTRVDFTDLGFSMTKCIWPSIVYGEIRLGSLERNGFEGITWKPTWPMCHDVCVRVNTWLPKHCFVFNVFAQVAGLYLSPFNLTRLCMLCWFSQ